MSANPVLRRLGFQDTDRVAIIHTDDIGMCQASVEAFARLSDVGLITSGAVMVPCPWFFLAADYARRNPQADLGVHVTLTSEWNTYRWGPISTRDPQSGLIDDEGCFYRTTAEVFEHADPAYAWREIEAQVQRALAAGMQPTHMDTHMGAVGSDRLIPGYLKVALAYRLPPLMMRLDQAGWMAAGLNQESAAIAVALTAQFEALGLPLLDRMFGLDVRSADDPFAMTKQAFAALQPGITHFILHPSIDSPELRAITPDWRGRVADYETFMREDLRRFIHDQGIHLIGYRALQTLMPDPASLPDLPF